MDQSKCNEERFLKDVSKHTMKTLHDNGVFRCLRFDNGGSSNMHFTLTTWPGYLSITGDMGDFMFSRLDDMFEFFRTKPREETLPINPSYWGEKCRSISVFGGKEEFDVERFEECVKEHFDNHFEDCEDEEAKAECWSEIKDQVLGLDPETSENAIRVTYAFEHEGFSFQDFWEHRLTRPTYHFIWCLYAITWGIRQYDAAQIAAESVTQ